MTHAATQEEIAAATAYEDLHVPAIFRQWAPRVLEAAQLQTGQRVLDVACGTGVLAREAAVLLGDEGSVTGLDASPGMLAVASKLAPAVNWKQGLAESPPFDDDSFDAVVSQFGLMFFMDRPKALREMLRVLVPGGSIAVAVWESLENSEAYPIEVALLERIAGTPAADALRAPFVLGDKAELTQLFADAGVGSVEIATHHGTAHFPSIRIMVEADLRGWLPVMGVMLAEDQIQHILEEAEHALSDFVTAEGTVKFDSPAHIIAGGNP
ncbi:MAG: class I SAM-dependent methyltransferase [Gammaproteobacteria bacterium]|nr:class I SAM-dependent methyltransferase [Gammaproteobacteria bacterium]MDH3767189.1 class I SAM-dependent methyltransferase [Gammaproteobacteria bacterium]